MTGSTNTYAQGCYIKDGLPSGWLQHIRLMLRMLRQSYGNMPAVDFGPLALKALRQEMIDAGHSRGYLNKMIAIIPRVFKWAVGEELIPVAIYEALAAVAGLRKGRTAARGNPSRSNPWRMNCSTPRCPTCPRSWPIWSDSSV